MRSPTEGDRSIFSFQTMVDFVLILLGHALGLDHHAALMLFRANVLKHAKTKGFFQQRELRKPDTAREVCVGMAAQIAVTLQASEKKPCLRSARQMEKLGNPLEQILFAFCTSI